MFDFFLEVSQKIKLPSRLVHYIGGVIVGLLDMSVVDQECESRTGQPKIIKLVFVASLLSRQY